MIGPLFSTKSIWMAQFFWIPMWKAPIFWHPGICTYFRSEIFEAAYPFGITWIDCDVCITTSNKWVQKIKGQYMNRSTFWMIKYMNGSVFSKARYMNGVGFEILARPPVTKLPLSYPPPPPPPPPPHGGSRKQFYFYLFSENSLGISCESSAKLMRETSAKLMIHRKCQNFFSLKNK